MKKNLLVTTLALLIYGCGGGNGGGATHKAVYPTLKPSYLYHYSRQANPAPKKVLILYDNNGPYAYMGKEMAILLQNLLGHFDPQITAIPATDYHANALQNYDILFYLGTTDDSPNLTDDTAQKAHYAAFLHDVALTDKPVVWSNYNLALLEEAWDENGWDQTTFAQKYGFTLQGVSDEKYNRVRYKDTELYKGVVPFKLPGADVTDCIHEGDNSYDCATELNLVKIEDNDTARVVATTYSTLEPANGPKPYVVHSKNFWFIGDLPMTYMSEEDRYLAFADLLHDMIGIEHNNVPRRALVRLEDISAGVKPEDVAAVTGLLDSKQIPYTMAVIPQYEDPLGAEHNGKAVSISMADSPVREVLYHATTQGLGSIVQHGYTHQFDAIPNPYDGVTADDFEFMRVIDEGHGIYNYVGPTGNDSGPWAKARIDKGRQILHNCGLEAFGWEAPHYMAGPNHYRAIRETYPIQYSRMIYFPNENSDDPAIRYKFIGQFFPYCIKHDLYGYFIVPEDLMNVEAHPNPGYHKLMPADIIRHAKKLKVVRDGVASFFYHPFLGTEYLKEIVEGVEKEGYHFVPATSLIPGLKKIPADQNGTAIAINGTKSQKLR